ncbi:putative non-specific serine/threonine protein kinase [Helianthus annuus]|nr:putative non-specific serine/threonine protein kinase [Helianthus annuus]
MEERRMIKTKLIFSFLVFYTSVTCSFAADTISPNQIVRYNETIISPQETFELDFFSPPNSTNHYVGIWYKISKGTVVWVANRNTPLSDTSSELTLTHQGVLILRNATTGDVIWSSVNSSVTSVRNPIGQLLDTGNFIIYNDGGAVNQEDPIWQSFDFITDTFLPGMKLGRNLVTGIERNFTSWKSDNDPASGVFSNWIDTRGYPQMILTRGGEIMFRGGPWNGLRFSGTPNLILNPLYNFTFVLDRREIYYQYILASSVMIRIVLQSNGHLEILKWSDNQQEWSLYTTPQIDRCDNYKVCGPFGSCNIESSPVCMCLKGFEPTSPDQVTDIEWSKGCRHTIPLNCDPGEGFNKYTNLKLPDTQGSWYNQTMTLVECEEMCKSNCSCTAYTNSNRSGAGSGCLLWFGDLMDIRSFSTNGDTLYIRLSASELDSIENSRSSSAGRRLRVIIPMAFVVSVILVIICLFCRYRKKHQQQGTSGNKSGHELENSSVDEDLELPLFGLSTILKATNNFSMAVLDRYTRYSMTPFPSI